MNNIRYTLVAALFLALFSSCNSWDKPEPNPAYVYIPEIKLANKPYLGTLKQDFTESWVYYDGQLLGAYPIPGVIPILGTGAHTLSIFAGIHDNGLKSQPDLYPLLDKLNVSVNLVSGKIDTIFPVVKYRDDITAAILEDFEGGSTTFSTNLVGKGIQLTNVDPFEGKQCGVFNLDTLSPLIEVGSNDITTFPTDGRKIFLELHYKNDVDFLVGVKGYNSTDSESNYLVGLRPSSTWKKVYIDITEDVLLSQYKVHKILIQTGLPYDGTTFQRNEAKVWIDNFKVLY